MAAIYDESVPTVDSRRLRRGAARLSTDLYIESVVKN